MKQFLQKINLSAFFFDILMVTVVFALAFCLADYLGSGVQTPGVGLGWISCVLLLLSMKIMEFYFLSPAQLDSDHQFLMRVFPALARRLPDKKGNPSYIGLILLLLCLGTWAVIQFILLKMGLLQNDNLILMAFMLLTVYLLTGSSFHLSNSGFGELGQAFLLFGLIPLYAYQLVSSEFHILILLLSLPLTLFYIAGRVLISLFQYSEDQKNGKKNFLQVVGWKRGMQVHNLFILIGFVIYACIPLFRFPPNIFLNPLLSLPLGVLLIIMMNRIEHGKKPEWQSFIFLEKILLLLVMYFLAAAMILR
jgi:1,4-dihydroxy-2-naphthoate octaprenyltransferase